MHGTLALGCALAAVVETVFLAEDGWLALYRNAPGNGTDTDLLGRTAVDGGGLERDGSRGNGR